MMILDKHRVKTKTYNAFFTTAHEFNKLPLHFKKSSNIDLVNPFRISNEETVLHDCLVILKP